MDLAEFVEHHPMLWHMAEIGSWPSIADNGLRSTTALLDLFEIVEPERAAIESQRRAESVRLHHPLHGDAVIRDNKPLNELRLEGILEGCTLTEFYRLLNRRVFLWGNKAHLAKLLAARAYRDRSHTVISFDTARLVQHNSNAITLSRINSGATLFGNPPRRGPATFETIAGFAPRTSDGRRRRQVVEVAVDYAIADVQAVTLAVDNHHPDGSVTSIWRR